MTAPRTRLPVSTRREGREASDLLPLFEFSNVVNSSLDLTFILNTVLRTLMGKMLVAKGTVLLRQSDQSFEVIAAKGVDASMIHQRMEIPRQYRATKGLREISAGALSDFMRVMDQHLLIPVASQKMIVGYITLGNRLTKKVFSQTERRLIQSLVNLSGAAIEKALVIDQVRNANRQLDRKNQELNTLFDLSKEFNIGLDRERVVRLLMFALLGQVGVKHYAICLQEAGIPVIVSSKLPAGADLIPVLKPLCQLKRGQSVQDLFRQRAYRVSAAQLFQLGIQAVIPMEIQGVPKGMILLGERLRGGTYSQEDFEFLYSLGNLAIISIENARLFQEGLEKQRMEDELIIAREIQQGLLPERLPALRTIDVSAENVPSKEVGGDYYDMLRRADGSTVIAIGDVSGKGTPAALLMANVQAALRALAPDCVSLSETTGRINDLTYANTKGAGRFITFFWGILSPDEKTFHYVNAGHNPPFLLRADGRIERLEKGGLLLGVFKTASPYESASVELEKGDLLVLYTDGVSEAMNSASEEFGEERLLSNIQRTAKESPAEILAAIRSAVLAYASGEAQSDDLTLVVIKKRTS